MVTRIVIAKLLKLTKWSIDKNGTVKFRRGRRNVNGLHLLEAAERMAFRHQLGNGSLVKGAGDE